MPQQTLHIKNMVCPRCIKVVREELQRLGLNVITVRLGTAVIDSGEEDLPAEAIRTVLKKNGFALLESRESRLVEAIKVALIDYIRQLEENEAAPKLSVFLKDRFSFSYNYLSSLFSHLENLTIEKYLILLKIERVKELLSYDELTLSEIAYRLQYSSVQYLSNQFKQITGMTVSAFRDHPFEHRHSFDRINPS